VLYVISKGRSLAILR